MSITVMPDGRLVTEDFETAIQLAQRLSLGRGRRKLIQTQDSAVVPLEWNGFVGLLGEKQRELLEQIRIEDGVSIEQLQGRLECDTPQNIIGLLASIRRAVKRAGLQQDEIFRREERPVEKGLIGIYSPGPALKNSEPLVDCPRSPWT